mmetsp:Transcript_24999/g.56711  ORF Transcript_24999/g.56711 Transcript_24999/m.56711 type:complete len:103 (-) Transcript_24999:1305-1613(-)
MHGHFDCSRGNYYVWERAFPFLLYNYLFREVCNFDLSNNFNEPLLVTGFFVYAADSGRPRTWPGKHQTLPQGHKWEIYEGKTVVPKVRAAAGLLCLNWNMIL